MTNNGVIPVFVPVLSANPNFSVFKGCDDFGCYPDVHLIHNLKPHTKSPHVRSNDKEVRIQHLKVIHLNQTSTIKSLSFLHFHSALGSLSVHDQKAALLIQFWARTGAGKDVFLLTTTNQPYGVCGKDGKLDLFRESCLQQKFFIDLAEDVSYGFPGLVFKTETRQQTRNMNFYNPEVLGGNTTPSTCSTAKKKECVGVLEFITTKSMTSYEADMDLVEKALEVFIMLHKNC
ncbi:hypothetical protein Tco_0579538 [Tanacetum coccineum]